MGQTLDFRMIRFEDQLQTLRSDLVDHPLYAQIDDMEKLGIFMRSHVFAVWDFMSLLKTLQRNLTCVEIPWLPSSNPEAARFINEIVVAEESDEVSPGVFLSHFELYLQAMTQAGADCLPIRRFTERIGLGQSPEVSFVQLNVARGVQEFVHSTLRFCSLAPHQVAAVFLYGREDIIPDMFKRLLIELNLYDSPAHARLRLYLERHIEIDGDAHGPLARKLLSSLCGESETKWAEALCVAQEAMLRRKGLWDSILHELRRVHTASPAMSAL